IAAPMCTVFPAPPSLQPKPQHKRHERPGAAAARSHRRSMSRSPPQCRRRAAPDPTPCARLPGAGSRLWSVRSARCRLPGGRSQPSAEKGMRQVVGKPSRESRGRARRAIGLTGIAALLPVVLAGCSLEEVFYLGWPRTKPTDQSELMMNLWVGSMLAAAAVGLTVWGLTFWCIAAYRKRDNKLPEQERLGEEFLPPQTKYNLPAELTFTGLPFILIGVLFYFTVIVQDEVTHISEKD